MASWETGNNSKKEEQANQNKITEEVLESEVNENGGKIQSTLEIGPTSFFFEDSFRSPASRSLLFQSDEDSSDEEETDRIEEERREKETIMAEKRAKKRDVTERPRGRKPTAEKEQAVMTMRMRENARRRGKSGGKEKST